MPINKYLTTSKLGFLADDMPQEYWMQSKHRKDWCSLHHNKPTGWPKWLCLSPLTSDLKEFKMVVQSLRSHLFRDYAIIFNRPQFTCYIFRETLGKKLWFLRRPDLNPRIVPPLFATKLHPWLDCQLMSPVFYPTARWNTLEYIGTYVGQLLHPVP